MSKKNTNSVHIRFNVDLLEKIDLFSDKFHFNSRAEAIRYLVSLGLNYHKIADDIIIRKSKNDLK